MAPVSTIMVGRTDDWIKVVANKHDIITDPGRLEWAGVAVMKHAYRLYSGCSAATRSASSRRSGAAEGVSTARQRLGGGDAAGADRSQ
jgi:hypothetical protein